MKLSELNPKDIEDSHPLKLSDLNPSDVEHVDENAPGSLEAIARGAGQGLSLGFADELAGALGKLTGGDYTESRDKYRKADDAAHAAHPYLYGGGELAGGVGNAVGTAFVPILNIGKLGSVGARIAAMSGIGAAAGLGSSKADLTQGQISDAVKDTIKGGAIGGALGGVAEKVGSSLNKLASGETAENLAIRHLRPTPQTARVLGKDRLREIGRETLDSGAIQPFQKAEDTASRLGELAEKAGKAKGDIVASSSGQVDPVAAANRFDKEVIEPLRGTIENKAIVEQLEAKKALFLQEYAPESLHGRESSFVPVQKIEAEKMAAQSNINYQRGPDNLSAKIEAQRGWADVLRTESENAINDPAFLASKKQYGNLKAAEAMAGRTAALTDGGTGLLGHLTDVGINTSALNLLAHGNPVGLGYSGVRALTKGKVASTAATAADFASNLIQKVSNSPTAMKFLGPLQQAAQRSPQALATTHYILSQTEPEYQRAMEGMGSER